MSANSNVFISLGSTSGFKEALWENNTLQESRKKAQLCSTSLCEDETYDKQYYGGQINVETNCKNFAILDIQVPM